MKNLTIFLAVCFLYVSCKKSDLEVGSSTSIGGKTDLAMNAVGNEFFGSIKIGNNYFDTNESIKVTKSEDGVLTVSIKADLPSSSPLVKLIPSVMKDSDGKLNTVMKFKNTSEGILDYTNKDGSPFVMVKYDGNIGDKYVLNKKDGNTITRTVVGKSTVDEYPYGFYNIKVMTVEQDSRIPGVKKILYRANHKFGLVEIEIVMEDGTSTHMYMFSVK